MGVLYVKTGGSLSGTYSTPDDWTGANCHPNIATALGKPWVDGDEIVCFDQALNQASILTSTYAGSGTAITVRSASNDPALATINLTSATANGIGHSKPFNLTFKGFTINKTVTHTGTAAAIAAINGGITASIIFDTCIIQNVTVDASSGNGVFSSIYPNVGTLRFVDTIIQDVDVTYPGGIWFANCSNTTTVEIVRSTIQRVANTSTGDNDSLGGIYAGNIVLEDSVIDDVMSVNNTTTGSLHYGFFYSTNAAAAFSGSNNRLRNMHVTGGQASAAIFTTGPYSWQSLHFNNVKAFASVGSNSIGGCFAASGNNAQGSGVGIYARSCESDYGTVLYTSQGAGGTFREAYSRGNRARSSAVFYAGGWGDQTLEDFASIGDEAAFNPQYVSDHGIIYGHVNIAAPRAPTRVYRSGLIHSPRLPSDKAVIVARNATPGYPNNVVIDDVQIVATTNRQIQVVESASCEVNISGNYKSSNGALVESRSGTGVSNIVRLSPTGRTVIGVSRGLEATRVAA